MSIKKLAGQTVIYGMAHILPRALNFIFMTTYLTYRLKDPQEFGIFSDLYANSTIILVLMVFRLDTAYFRFASRKEKTDRDLEYSTAFLPLAFISILITALMIIFSQNIANVLDYPDRPEYVKWFALILGFDAFTTLLYGRFRLDNRPWKFLFYRVANVVMTIFFLLLFFEFAPHYASSLLKSVDDFFGIKKDVDYAFIANLLASLLVFLMMIPDMIKLKLSFDSALFKKMMTYALPLVIVGLAGMINQFIATPIQKYFLGGDTALNLQNAGIYSAAAKLAILLSLFTTAFNYAAEPFFFNNASKENSKEAYGNIALAYTLFASLVVLGTYFYIDIFVLLIGKGYREGITVVPILLMSYFFLGLYYNFSIWYKLADKTWYGAYISVSASVITLVISIVMLPIIGYMASAWAALACFLFEACAGYITGQKHYPLHYPIKKIIFYTIVVGVLLVTSYLTRSVLTHQTMVVIAVNSIMLMFFVALMWQREKSWLRGMRP